MSKFVTCLVILSLTGLVLLVYLQLDAPVEKVTVSGRLDEAERQQIREVVREIVDGGLLSANLVDLKSGILALSWPRGVTIRRAWPGGLEIEVEKPMVVARWQDGFLASDGKVVQLPGSRIDLPRFDCRSAEPRVAMEVFHQLSEAGAAHGLDITQLNENELGEWSLKLAEADRTGELEVRLGAQRVAERFGRFLIVYRQKLRDRDARIVPIDARYDNGVAVNWRSADPTLVAARRRWPRDAGG